MWLLIERPVLFSIFQVVILFCPKTAATDDDGLYRVGVGRGDITGPPAGVVLNGHVRPTLGAGIHTRQYAHTFMVESKDTGEVSVFVTCDMGMIDHSMKSEVVSKLSLKFGTTFKQSNIMISATHTHSGVSGFMTYYSYLAIESYGFNPVSYWAVVNGIVDSIEEAANSLEDAVILYGSGELLEANRNRRVDQYLMNPEEERDSYPYNTDKEMFMLKFERVDGGGPFGAFFWYPFHPLSFNQRETNPLVCSEGNGYAAIKLEADLKNVTNGKFLTAFASSNLGDVAPDNNPSEERIRDEIDEDMQKLVNNGGKLYKKAKEIFATPSDQLVKITGPVTSVHQYVDTATVQVEHFDQISQENVTLSLCKPALGFGYVGLDPEEYPWLELIRDLIKVPSEEMVQCQMPKEIAVAAGEMFEPWPWAPATVELQLLQIGSIILPGLPGEFTTMAGRRVRKAVEAASSPGSRVLLAGLSNNYINYVATPEEYELQEYEAGATIYGRNTLPVVTTLFERMATALSEGTPEIIPVGEEGPNLLHLVRPEIPPWKDSVPASGAWFGDVISDVEPLYRLGEDKAVKVRFLAGSPRHSSLRGGSFLAVEKKDEGSNKWTRCRTDADVDTIFSWSYFTQSVEITWFLDQSPIEPGEYRIRHFGYYRLQADGLSVNYLGSSSTFQLVE